ncbi:hypothetical protein HAU47_06340 [Weissella confusa]|uniref:hypothetical protein n=1 Tax=Weissella confusa TaxID=1583 RepID=UPI0011C0E941|nr:hypothetical protein [Weissella confusa]MBJ7620908.1 hypothetical protein [Weissella confusa]MBJ7667538.1 hypothetical protein [Weissella confusa]MBJ7678233.1 hypothetical protein [Weissella confusa]MBJ7682996.1 hypothetical protein [Weissella confusa]MBJ7703774.1 hypothetical protein [Weissella confusa]
MANKILLYLQFSPDLAERSGFKAMDPMFSFMKNGSLTPLDIPDSDKKNQFYIDDVEEGWDASQDNLRIERTFSFSDVSKLFGDSGVLATDGEIGIAAHVYSQTSGYQDNIPFGVLNPGQQKGEYTFQKAFDPAFLKGTLKIEIYIYVKKLGQPGPFFADMVGSKLGTLSSFEIIVDGDGSVFPIVEVDKPGNPLWSLIVLPGVDFATDQFSADNARLELNKKHPMFNKLTEAKTQLANYLMIEILANAMTQLIYMGREELESLSSDDFVQGSLAAAINYWIETFELDIDSFSETNSQLRLQLEETLKKEDKSND